MFRMLVCDPDLLASMERERWFLHPSRYQVLRATTGTEAIAHARRMRPDLMIAAQALTDGPGIAAVRGVRHAPNCADLPAILVADPVSALDMGFRQKATAAGIQAIVARPIGRTSFSGKRIDMPSAVARKRSLPPSVLFTESSRSPSSRLIAMMPPERGFPYSESAVFLIVPFSVAKTR